MNPKASGPIALIVSLMVFSLPGPVRGEAVNCLKCHGDFAKGKFVHQAVNMGCISCHSGVDGRRVPHPKTSSFPHGLASAQPDLCYACHDKELFSKKTVHGAIGMGCSACHSPHSSNTPKLLTSALPGLCFACHDDAGFRKKQIHAPVAAGKCMTCHAAHASDEIALLAKTPIDTCVQCHKDTPHGQHISSTPGTPEDPKRPGKPFYCGTCHDPHSTDSPLLFRFNAQSMQDLCVNCHTMN